MSKRLISRVEHYLLYRGYPGLRLGKTLTESTQMNTMLLKMFVKFQILISREEGQDLVEYALIIALVALGATAAMKTLATGISSAFTSISTQLSSAVV
jgi:pilus assembly protein Flp/PilA